MYKLTKERKVIERRKKWLKQWTLGVILPLGKSTLQLTPLIEKIHLHIESFDLDSAVDLLRKFTNEMSDNILASKINEIFGNQQALEKVRPCVDTGYTYHESREVSVQMPFGTKQKIKSHWFKKNGNCGRRKKGPKAKNSGRKGSHIFLDLLGFEGLVSQPLYNKALKMSALCPSSAIASEILKDDGIVF